MKKPKLDADLSQNLAPKKPKSLRKSVVSSLPKMNGKVKESEVKENRSKKTKNDEPKTTKSTAGKMQTQTAYKQKANKYLKEDKPTEKKKTKTKPKTKAKKRTKAQRSESAKKGWETRRKNPNYNPSESARKGWETRRKNPNYNPKETARKAKETKERKQAEKSKRSEAAKKGWITRRKKQEHEEEIKRIEEIIKKYGEDNNLGGSGEREDINENIPIEQLAINALQQYLSEISTGVNAETMQELISHIGFFEGQVDELNAQDIVDNYNENFGEIIDRIQSAIFDSSAEVIFYNGDLPFFEKAFTNTGFTADTDLFAQAANNDGYVNYKTGHYARGEGEVTY